MEKMKRLLSVLLTLCMILGMFPGTVFATGESANPFTDVRESEWYYDAVQYAYQNGMMSGTGNGAFSPDAATTRGMIVTILYQMEGKPAAGAEDFTDVEEGQYYTAPVAWASTNGIVGGYGNNLFGPNDPITREQLATILYKYAKYKEYDTAVPGDLTSFVDDDQVSGYAVEPMEWAVGQKLISGFGGNTLAPAGNANRAQAATILMYFNKNVAVADEPADVPTDPPAAPSEGAGAETPAVYTVNFAYNYYGAGSYKTVEVQAGGTVERPADPVRAGYVFDGWCVKEIGGAKFDFGAPVNKDTTVYAMWKVKSFGAPVTRYAVTFDSNGGSAVEGQAITAGAVAVRPADPTKEGFGFAGWYSDPELTTAYDFTAPVVGNITLYAKWIEAGEKVVSSEVAELFGIDPDVPDADGDGLLSYDELYVLGTDPAKADSDENGITDGNEDADCDGISNLDEIALGTEPVKVDSDDDGLSDYDEINTYNTDPVNPDSDNDTLSDGDEIELGLNPLVVMSDGTTPDAERTFTQELSEENIDESLLDSAAVPSLSLTASGNINSSVFVSATGSSEFTDSRAIVGQAVDITGVDDADGTVSFALSAGASTFATRDTTDEISTHLICKYDENGDISYLDTQYSDGVVSAPIDGEGTYYVMDVQALFDELGLELPSVADIDALSDPEPISTFSLRRGAEVERTNGNNNAGVATFSMRSAAPVESPATAVAADAGTEKITRASGGAMAQADIVFLIDTTGSMGDAIYNVKENVGYFIDELKEKGVSAALALIDFQDITVDGYDSTRIHKNGTSNWFYNMDDYKEAIYALDLGYGGDTPECAVDALETARLLDMRASAGKIFVLVTDADYKVDNRYDIPSMEAEIELLKNAGVSCSVVSSEWDQYVYEDLYTQTDGVWADIYGNFYEELMKVADKIGSDIVGDGYWIYLKGPVPVPVRLDEQPYDGSTVDTDKDGIPDVKELEGAEPTKYIDLDELVTKLSHGVITGTDYGKVMMYEYASSPVESDTDFDGIGDDKDVNSKSGKFKGVLANSFSEGINVEFTVDYRKLVDNSNTQYSSEKSALASIFMTLAYGEIERKDGKPICDEEGFFKRDKSTIKVTSGASAQGTIKAMYDMVGLSDYAEYSMSDMEEYKDDDITEFMIGHRLIRYQEKDTEVFVVSVRGTNGTVEEWSSNFDVGAKDANYWDYKNEEWDEEDHHKGFDVAANRCYALIEKYIEDGIRAGKISATANKSIFITGHSRGAAIANLLGKKFEDDPTFKSSTYGFATPNTTTAKNADSYKTIFNVVNKDDLVPYLPLDTWGFTKYGTTKAKSVKEEYENSWFGAQEGTWEWLINANRKDSLDYNYNGHKSDTLKAFAKVISGTTSKEIRKSLYVKPYDEDSFLVLDKKYETEESARADIKKVEEAYGKRLARASSVFVLQTYEPGFLEMKTVYKLIVAQSPEFLMMTVAAVAGKEEPKDDGLASELVGFTVKGLGYKVAPKYNDAKKQFIHSAIDVVGEDGVIWGGLVRLGGMVHGHWTETYHLLAKYLK